MLNIDQAQTFNCLAWILKNQIMNENGSPMEFADHPFLIEPYMDCTPRQAIIKCSQIGWSVLAIIRAFHLAYYAKANVIHTFPSRNMSKDFVIPKVNPIIEKNPIIQRMIGKDSVFLKQIGDRYIYYRGTYEQTEAISISANILINDEYDRCFLSRSVEVLTKKGWKLIEHITKSDYVLVRHPFYHNVSFKKPTEIIEQNYNGQIFTLKGRGVNIPATKNHRFLVRTDSKKNEMLKISEFYMKPFTVNSGYLSRHDLNKRAVIPYLWTKRTGKGSSGLKILSFPAKEVDSEAWFEFLGWYISEGSLGFNRNYLNEKKVSGQIVITQKSKENLKLILDCVHRLDYNPKLYQYGDGATQVSFSDMHLALYLQKLGKVHDKHIPKRWLWSDPKLCRIMMKSLLLGDGDSRNVYTTVSKQLADDVQILALQIGKTAHIYKSGHTFKVGIHERTERRFNGKRKSNTKAHVEVSNYLGKVHCIEVPFHTMLVRSRGGGLPIWSGNSNPKVLRTYRSRLDDSARERPELGWEWKFSNPSIPGYGVDQDWQRSDMKHWFVKCRYCGHEGYLRWPESIDFKRKVKICYKCKTELTKDDLRNGRWVKKYLNRSISGYWLSQLFVPWISAEKIIEDSKGDKTIFYNFTLGLPYVSKDTTVSRQSISDCISPGYNSRTDVAIGVDNGIIKHYVIGNRQGIFDYGKTDSWEEIEDLRNRYAATMVIDAMPYPNTPSKLAEKYLGKVFVHYYQRDASSADLVRWNRESRTVKSDRTKIIDYVVGEINSRDMTFNLTITELEEYFKHWKSMYRIIEDQPSGVKRPKWSHIEGQPDHYAHATIYWRIALEQTLNMGGISRSSNTSARLVDKNPVVSEDQTVGALDLEEVAERAGRRRRR